MSASQDSIIDSVFKKFDRNNDGSISQKELQSALKDVGVSLNAAQVDKLMDTIDRNHDGQIWGSDSQCLDLHSIVVQ